MHSPVLSKSAHLSAQKDRINPFRGLFVFLVWINLSKHNLEDQKSLENSGVSDGNTDV